MSAENQSRLDSVVASVSQTLIALLLAWFGMQVIESKDRLTKIEANQSSIMESVNKIDAQVSKQEHRLRAIE